MCARVRHVEVVRTPRNGRRLLFVSKLTLHDDIFDHRLPSLTHQHHILRKTGPLPSRRRWPQRQRTYRKSPECVVRNLRKAQDNGRANVVAVAKNIFGMPLNTHPPNRQSTPPFCPRSFLFLHSSVYLSSVRFSWIPGIMLRMCTLTVKRNHSHSPPI